MKPLVAISSKCNPSRGGLLGLIQDFEKRLQSVVEVSLARTFRSGIEPVELSRRVMREMYDNKMVSVGRVIAPNRFIISLAQMDMEKFRPIESQLKTELVRTLNQYAAQEGWTLMGPIEILLESDPDQAVGTQHIRCETAERPVADSGILISPDGQRIELSDRLSFGRSHDCDVILQDHNCSRHHAEVRKVDEGFEVVDLGSTNGTFINNVQVQRQVLREGDALRMGRTTFRFVTA